MRFRTNPVSDSCHSKLLRESGTWRLNPTMNNKQLVHKKETTRTEKTTIRFRTNPVSDSCHSKLHKVREQDTATESKHEQQTTCAKRRRTKLQKEETTPAEKKKIIFWRKTNCVEKGNSLCRKRTTNTTNELIRCRTVAIPNFSEREQDTATESNREQQTTCAE